MKYLIAIYCIICIGYLTTHSFQNETLSEIPTFIVPDTIAADTSTPLQLYIPDAILINANAQYRLRHDYKSIWKHLNNFYKYNNPNQGKEYYTQEWFKLISNNYASKTISPITRRDLNHEIHIQSWSDDGLVCTAIDSNVVLEYKLDNLSQDSSIIDTNHIALILLYQGDHWRIHAMNFLPKK